MQASLFHLTKINLENIHQILLPYLKEKVYILIKINRKKLLGDTLYEVKVIQTSILAGSFIYIYIS